MVSAWVHVHYRYDGFVMTDGVFLGQTAGPRGTPRGDLAQDLVRWRGQSPPVNSTMNSKRAVAQHGRASFVSWTSG